MKYWWPILHVLSIHMFASCMVTNVFTTNLIVIDLAQFIGHSWLVELSLEMLQISPCQPTVLSLICWDPLYHGIRLHHAGTLWHSMPLTLDILPSSFQHVSAFQFISANFDVLIWMVCIVLKVMAFGIIRLCYCHCNILKYACTTHKSNVDILSSHLAAMSWRHRPHLSNTDIISICSWNRMANE